MQDTSITTNQTTEQHSVGHWTKTHKKQLIGVGIGITVVIGAALFLKSKEDASTLLEELPEQPNILPDSIEVEAIAPEDLTQPLDQISPDNLVNFPSAPAEKFSYKVARHIRSLHEGWHASPEKIATAAEHGYDLNSGETWVEECTKNRDIA